jgi:hypothetical protein
MASDSPNTGAAFTYSLELDVIKIQDLNTGTKRVADDIKNVLRKIESWHQGPIIGYRIMCLESNGLWTGVDWDSKSVGFFALGETDESAATKSSLCSHGRRSVGCVRPIDPVRRHILGQYDFSEERLQDTDGIKPPQR